MPNFREFFNVLTHKPIDGVPELDESRQRRLVLTAVSSVAPDRLPAFRKRQPTFAEFDLETRENSWMLLVFGWALIGLLALEDILPSLRIREAIRQNWRDWLDQPHPDCERWILEGDLLRLLNSLPRRQRKVIRGLEREIRQLGRHADEISKQLAAVEQKLRAVASDDLQSRLAVLRDRYAGESDPVTAGTLERQIRSIEGQMEAGRIIDERCRRLQGALGEQMETLRHLYTRLTVLATGNVAGEEVLFSEACQEIQSVVGELSALQQAEEELVRVRAG